MNRNNLLKLAEGIAGIPEEFFKMSTFRSRDEDQMHISLEGCGSVGCAVGWGPFIKGLGIKKNHIDSCNHFAFMTYDEDLFFNNYNYWEWCFDGDWGKVDKTARGAALRIQELVYNGLPKNWRQQLTRQAPYMFAEILK